MPQQSAAIKKACCVENQKTDKRSKAAIAINGTNRKNHGKALGLVRVRCMRPLAITVKVKVPSAPMVMV